MDVNYLIEINGLDDWEMGNPLSATAYKVMRKLLMLANRQRFPERIAVTNNALCFLVGCSENSLIAARQQLIQRGLVSYSGKKKHTPIYTLHYFSLSPDYNRDICGYSGEYTGDMPGYGQGLPGGMDGGRILNNTDQEKTEEGTEEDCPDDDTRGRTTGRRMDTDVLQCPVPAQAFVCPPTRGRRFAPRTRKLAEEERFAWIAARNALKVPAVAAMYGEGLATMEQLPESDQYPLGLLVCAIEATMRRNGLYATPLENPAAYTLRLLDDWKRRGLTCREDVQEAKEDYWHYG